jgi:uroporphyrinogen decarboxylase
MLAVLAGRTPDRIPVFPNIHFGTARFGGATIREFATDAATNAQCLVKACREFGYDAVKVGCDVAVEGEAVGSVLEYPEDNIPSMKVPFLQEPEIGRLRVPDPCKDGRMPVFVESTALVSQAIGREAFVTSLIVGPMNCASQIRGLQNLLMDFYDRPEFVEELLDFAVQVELAYGKALIEAGAEGIVLGEALCSPSVISPSFYREFVVARQKELVRGLRAAGARHVVLHICGNIKKILAGCVETGADILDLDWMMNVSEVLDTDEIRRAGVTVCGNLNPAGVLLSKNPEEVVCEARQLIEENRDRGRFILSSGCNIHPDSVPDNLRAMVEAADRYGWYRA